MSLISVVVPSYRHGAYIEECLESVVEQTYSRVELIVLDDASPDRTFEIASDLCASAKYRHRFENVLCRRNERNEGAHASLNKGIGLAAGKYISLLNSDDQYQPGRLATLVDALESGSDRLVFSSFVFMDEEGREMQGHPLYLELQTALASASEDYPALSFAFLNRQVALSTGNLMFERELFKEVGGFVDLKYCHDWDFVLQSTRFSEPLFVDQPLYRYRVHSRNTFSGLADIAEVESDFVRQRYFALCFRAGTPNNYAPSEKNWPGVFSMLIKSLGVNDLYARAVTGYLPRHRTID